jgi:small subunit ribosomal protein S13
MSRYPQEARRQSHLPDEKAQAAPRVNLPNLPNLHLPNLPNDLMVRLSGIVLPQKKRIEAALTSIKGIGRSLSRTILLEAKISFDTKTDDITETQEAQLRSIIDRYETEGDLTRRVSMDIRRLQDIRSYRGYRHSRKLPVRGQTSRRNARTRRGKKKTGLSGRVTLTKT